MSMHYWKRSKLREKREILSLLVCGGGEETQMNVSENINDVLTTFKYILVRSCPTFRFVYCLLANINNGIFVHRSRTIEIRRSERFCWNIERITQTPNESYTTIENMCTSNIFYLIFSRVAVVVCQVIERNVVCVHGRDMRGLYRNFSR